MTVAPQLDLGIINLINKIKWAISFLTIPIVVSCFRVCKVKKELKSYCNG